MRKRYVRHDVVAWITALVLCGAGYLALSSSEAVYAAVGQVAASRGQSEAVLHGKVTKPDHEPVAHVLITVQHKFHGKFRVTSHTRTNRRGLYRIGVRPGKLGIVFAVAGHKAVVIRRSSAGTRLELSAEIKGAEIRFWPFDVAGPRVNGTAQQDKTLIATHGRWSQHPKRYGYQWQAGRRAGWSNIRRATHKHYRVLGPRMSVTAYESWSPP